MFKLILGSGSRQDIAAILQAVSHAAYGLGKGGIARKAAELASEALIPIYPEPGPSDCEIFELQAGVFLKRSGDSWEVCHYEVSTPLDWMKGASQQDALEAAYDEFLPGSVR